MSTNRVNYPDPGFCTKTSLIQLAIGVWISLSLSGIGLVVGFIVVLLPQLAAPGSRLKLTPDDISWIVTAITYTVPVGCFLSGLIIDYWGRRLALVLCQLPILGGWFYTAFAETANEIITGRIMSGLGVGMSIPAPRVYAAEMALPNMRGVIGVFPNVAVFIGLIVEGSVGIYVHWRTMCFINGIFSALLLFSYFCVPESPFYLLMIDKLDNAKESLARLRSKEYNVDIEMEEMEEFKRFNNIRRLPLWCKIKALFEPSACKPFWILLIFIGITQFSGVSFVSFWTVEILLETNSSVSAAVGHVILAVTRFVGGMACIVLVYSVGRRNLSIVSGLGLGISFILLGLYEHAIAVMTIIPQICLTSYVFFASLGFHSIPVLLMSELYPLQVRGFFIGITLIITNFMMYMATLVYPVMSNGLGFTGTMYVCGLFGLLGCVFLFFCLPETKDVTLIEIEEYYNQLRPSLVSQREQLAQHNLQSSIEKWKSMRSPSLMSVASFAKKSRRTREEAKKIKEAKRALKTKDVDDSETSEDKDDRVLRFEDDNAEPEPEGPDMKRIVRQWKGKGKGKNRK